MTILIISLFLLLFVFIIFLPLSMTIKLHFNLVEKLCFYSVKLLFFNVLCGKIELKQDKLHILNFANKLPKNTPFGTLFAKQIIRQIQDIFCEVYVENGRKEDSAFSALESGFVIVGVNALFAILKEKKKEFYGNVFVRPSTKEDEFMCTVLSKIKFTLFDILMAFINTLFNLKEIKNGK